MQTDVQQPSERLTSVFTALADPTRRAVIHRLARGPATVSELARPFEMGLPSFLKHLRVLERSGMIRTRKEGRTRTCTIAASGLTEAELWLSTQRTVWQGRAERLEAFVLREQTEGGDDDAHGED